MDTMTGPTIPASVFASRVNGVVAEPATEYLDGAVTHALSPATVAAARNPASDGSRERPNRGFR
jgi:hypothetical protein